MLKQVIHLVILLCLSLSLTAQERVIITNNDLVGYWILEKAELLQEPLNSPEQQIKKVYSFSQLTTSSQDHFLLNSVVMSIRSDEDYNHESYVKFPETLIEKPEFEITDYPELFIFNEGKEVIFGRYKIIEISDSHLILNSGEVFYNEGSVPMKAELEMILNKQY